MAGDQRHLRTTFDSAAGLYQQARPEYPEELFDTLAVLAALGGGDRLLEIGCATGRATAPLARRGFRITCIEIGPLLAAAARRNLAGFPGVEVLEGTFETWRPPGDERFDLVFAATAWHWIDPAVRHRRAWELLRPGGHLAFWSATHVFPDGGDPFFAEIQDVYDEIGDGPPRIRAGRDPLTRPTAPPRSPTAVSSTRSPSAASTGRSATTPRSTFGCSTRSPATSMEAWQRERLYDEIRCRLAR